MAKYDVVRALANLRIHRELGALLCRLGCVQLRKDCFVGIPSVLGLKLSIGRVDRQPLDI
jgi:hypothetical protein